MVQASAPPKVPLAIRVGVIGHRLKKLPQNSEGLATLRSVTRSVLDRNVKTPLVALAKNRQSGYASDTPRLIIVSPLAEGADRIVAEEAMDLSFELQCPLPFPREEYKKDFEKDESRSRFEELLGKATAIAELEGNRKSSKQAYEAAGRVVLNYCDLLIAVWDGKVPELRGGTAQIVEEARQLNIPVVWIFADAPHPVCLLYDGSTMPLSAEYMEGYFRKGLILQDDNQVKLRERYFGESQPRIDLIGGVIKAFENLVLCKLPRIRWSFGDILEDTKSEWKMIWNNTEVRVSEGYRKQIAPQIEERFLGHYAWADKLANLYGGNYRSSFVLTYGLSGMAVGSAMLSLIWHGQWPFMLELFVILLILGITYWATWRGEWHSRWLDYRFLAESIRYMHFLWPLRRRGPTTHVPAHHRDGDPRNTWVNWMARAIERNAGLVQGIENAAFLQDQKKLLTAEVNEQLSYHDKTAERYKKIHHRLHLSGYALFLATLVVCAIHLVNPAVWLEQFSWWRQDWSSLLSNGLVALSAVFPALGAAIAGIVSQGEFHRIEVRSRHMAAQLKDFADRLSKDGEMSEVQLGNLAEGIARTMLAELVDWRVVYLRKPLSLPA